MLDFLAAVAIIASTTISIVHAVIAYKKSKEPPKDPAWEAALKLTLSQSNGACDPDTFAQYYEELQAFKENGCSRGDVNTLTALLRKKRERSE